MLFATLAFSLFHAFLLIPPRCQSVLQEADGCLTPLIVCVNDGWMGLLCLAHLLEQMGPSPVLNSGFSMSPRPGLVYSVCIHVNREIYTVHIFSEIFMFYILLFKINTSTK